MRQKNQLVYYPTSYTYVEHGNQVDYSLACIGGNVDNEEEIVPFSSGLRHLDNAPEPPNAVILIGHGKKSETSGTFSRRRGRAG